MPVNRDKPDLWNDDIARSVDTYNAWFLEFVPQAFQETRTAAIQEVEATLRATANLTDITPELLLLNPAVLSILRMVTAPPLARDRLVGLASVSDSLVESMDKYKRLPPRMSRAVLLDDMRKIGALIERLADPYLFPWLTERRVPTEGEIYRAATIVADRVCGSLTDPIIRNTQEQRQLARIQTWLEARGYSHIAAGTGLRLATMTPGTFSFRLNLPITQVGGTKPINIPVDVVIMPFDAAPGDLPVLIEAKSAGDYTNTNKRRKEEATKVVQLRATYGERVQFVLYLCGYFNSGYLGYEAAERIDWIWEHRTDDLALLGL